MKLVSISAISFQLVSWAYCGEMLVHSRGPGEHPLVESVSDRET